MKELDLQDKYLINFLCERPDGLLYNEAKANTVSSNFFILEDLKHFISETELNKANYRKLLKKFSSEKDLLNAFTLFLDEKVKSSMNMAIFINTNKSVTFEGVKLHLFYPSGSEFEEDKLFDQNVFSVVQEMPYTFKYEGKQHFSFRPDLSFFINGIYLGYSELKSNWTNQTATKNGRRKVSNDYLNAVQEYLTIADKNDLSLSIRKDFLKIFEKAIHITSTDISETYVIRNISNQFDEIKTTVINGSYDFELYEKKILKDFKPYPLRNKEAFKTQRFEEVFKALYDKKMIEKEILYYNFIERELIKKEGSKTKEYKHNDGRLISPRPKQKFGTDKVLSKISEFLEHENEPEYFIKKLDAELRAKGIGENQIKDLIAKRQKYQNNKTVYSLLLQYAAGFGKSNIIGWTALQLKDLRKDGVYVYDKVMLVVDRLQLRDQLDSKLHNMNIQKGMFIEASDKKSFLTALSSDKRIVVVNLQKFTAVNSIMDEAVVKKLSKLRIAFLIDEIHRSNSGVQHEEMISVFDELQSSFDQSKEYQVQHTKKNLIVGFTATPSDHTLARFGEFNKYAESEKIWIPFDSYTMREAIEDGYILNPIRGIVPVSAKMFFEIPDNDLEGFEGDLGYGFEEIPDNTDTGVDEEGKKYAIRKKKIYGNTQRIKAISKFIVERLLSSVYPNIRGTAKAMLAASSIPAAIKYKGYIDKYFEELIKDKKYERFADAPIYIVYSDSQEHRSANGLNGGINEEKVLQNFAIKKNGLIIVVDKLQTGFDEPKLHTLFLDKEIRGINAIQTISRVNRTAKYKNDCKIIDFSYKNVNVKNIKAAFEHFSNVVVSDFDPLGDEEKLVDLFKELNTHSIFKTNFPSFTTYHTSNPEVALIIAIEDAMDDYIRNSKEEAKKLKEKILAYFKILNLIEFVIELHPKYTEILLLNFWRKYNILYNQINKNSEIIDDVEIYFDNRIGIIAPKEISTKPVVAKSAGEYEDKKYRYNILKVIEKRNQEEEAIAELIAEFESKITSLFEFIKQDETGQRLVAKINDDGTAFSQDEIYADFSRIYRKFSIRNKELGDFFIRETKDILSQLCDDFERTLKESISKNTIIEIAEGYIYLATDDLLAAQNIFVKYSHFAEALGFEITDEGTFEQGSWIKKGIKMVQNFFKHEEAQEIYQKGKRSLELAYIEKVQAEIDGLKVGAAAQLLESVKGTSNVALKLGSIVLIKAEAEGKEQTLIFDLTDKQRQNLEKNGFLLNRPQELLQYLNN
ncbi:type I restriction endonuclease subunit R [Flavobacterium zepuense]|uniref:Type I restriction endonuclease subunit R n=1 Tax=Flavobacterium zepuense TaxID=2593302 RepID=A0A552UTJ1_9FLAO|nr:DEAD/DEAH box helicase family protein [Flavobacterium zepuense]TRW21543.1 type I restriction endonuclease subunit R [Flavobacterium zepuense]